MKNILAIFLVLSIAGCSTTAPVIAKFPEVPEVLTQPADKLTPLDTSKKVELSDIIENANENAGKYYSLREKYNAWIEWYNSQKKIFDSVK
jgi:hypothetical protein